ncbi:MAG: DUF5060 domain-containing protein [Prolixibacteraceae bacterium]|nr:DUF5060 domain-containing protein [Prolixibacteraceae bacterium]
MKKILWIILFPLFLTAFNSCSDHAPFIFEGETKCGQPITIVFEGPVTSEMNENNPFLNYRLNVLFVCETDTFLIPGYFAADGKAAETSQNAGNKWKVHFTPYKAGKWEYTVSFQKGENIAVSNLNYSGTPDAFDGIKGSFQIEEADKNAPGFLSKGMLRYNGKRYLQHSVSGDYFIKGGTDSPENFLAYAEFDNTPPNHYYAPHVCDWKTGDPTWQNGKGKGIIGSLNYLALQKMNVVYMLTMNVMGDGDDVYPWTSRNERYRFDCSKLDQWNIVFDHFDRLGIVMHLVTQENENQLLLDAGFTDIQRKLYYRELVARFAHHNGIIWNMGEENGPAPWFDNLGQTLKQRQTMAEYLRSIDPYRHLIVFHTLPGHPEQRDYILPLLGKKYIDGVSLQNGNVKDIHEEVKFWIRKSHEKEWQWIVNLDEIGPWYSGVLPDSIDPGHDTIRVHALWGALMAGAAGTEWYCGKDDLKLEDFRSREKMWKQTSIALDFFKSLPFYEMTCADEVVISENAWCFAKDTELYVIYIAQEKTAILNLSEKNAEYKLSWFNPANGKYLKNEINICNKGEIILNYPENYQGIDLVAILKKISP